jgi:hypothetical protein
MTRFGRAGHPPSCLLSELFLPRSFVIAEAVVDPMVLKKAS